jgi:S-adenosylhomocysteine hydrolase
MRLFTATKTFTIVAALAAMAAGSITTPALAVHKSTPMSHQNAYGTRSSQGSGVYSVPRACSFDCDWY